MPKNSNFNFKKKHFWISQKSLSLIFNDIQFDEKLIYKANMEQYMTKKRLNKRGNSWVWTVLIALVTTIAVGIIFFVILKDRLGGLFHL